MLCTEHNPPHSTLREFVSNARVREFSRHRSGVRNAHSAQYTLIHRADRGAIPPTIKWEKEEKTEKQFEQIDIDRRMRRRSFRGNFAMKQNVQRQNTIGSLSLSLISLLSRRKIVGIVRNPSYWFCAYSNARKLVNEIICAYDTWRVTRRNQCASWHSAHCKVGKIMLVVFHFWKKLNNLSNRNNRKSRWALGEERLLEIAKNDSVELSKNRSRPLQLLILSLCGHVINHPLSPAVTLSPFHYSPATVVPCM